MILELAIYTVYGVSFYDVSVRSETIPYSKPYISKQAFHFLFNEKGPNKIYFMIMWPSVFKEPVAREADPLQNDVGLKLDLGVRDHQTEALFDIRIIDTDASRITTVLQKKAAAKEKNNKHFIRSS